ncbi:MAG: hypothetical protein ACLVL7_03695 [Anaerotruncus massiliensis (ex Togo et al. 2019)]
MRFATGDRAALLLPLRAEQLEQWTEDVPPLNGRSGASTRVSR